MVLFVYSILWLFYYDGNCALAHLTLLRFKFDVCQHAAEYLTYDGAAYAGRGSLQFDMEGH